jgi:hypothetical protein
LLFGASLGASFDLKKRNSSAQVREKTKKKKKKKKKKKNRFGSAPVNGEENENEISMTTNTFESNNRDRYTKQKLTFDKNEWHKWSAAHAIKWIKALFNGNVGLNSNNSHSHSHINNNTNNNNDNNTNNNNINDDINNNDNNNIRANQCAIATTDEPGGAKRPIAQ